MDTTHIVKTTSWMERRMDGQTNTLEWMTLALPNGGGSITELKSAEYYNVTRRVKDGIEQIQFCLLNY